MIKSLLEKFRYLITFTWILFAIYWLFNSYFVRVFKENKWYDGLNRELFDTPLLLRLIQFDDQYPGVFWWAIDMLIFWGGIGFIFLIWKINIGSK